MRGEGAVLEGVEGVWIVETFRREQRLREVGCGIHKTDADEMDGQAYLWLRLRRMGRHIICGWGLRVIKMRQLSPLGGHGLSIKIWRIVYEWALCSSTQEQSKEISHRASISGSIRYMETPSLFRKTLQRGFGGYTSLFSQYVAVLPLFLTLPFKPSTRLQCGGFGIPFWNLNSIHVHIRKKINEVL